VHLSLYCRDVLGVYREFHLRVAELVTKCSGNMLLLREWNIGLCISVEFSQINDFIRSPRFAASAETIETIIGESRYTTVFRRIRLFPIF